MSNKTYRDSHLYSVYFAPRGTVRMLNLGMMLAQQHLSPLDRLIGVIGDPGSGKSMLVKGMFPGMELSNDDQGVNVRPLPILSIDEHSFYSSHTYHLDVRFEMGFTNIGVLAEAVREAIAKGKRVIVEHFELLYPYLGMNAELLIGVGEEVIITRPTIFGPEPQDIYEIVSKSQPYRKMAHTAENLTERFLAQYGDWSYAHGDVRHGFILEFDEKPQVDLAAIEAQVKECIRQDISISLYDETHILIGDDIIHPCTGPRIHVRSTGEIKNFILYHDFLYDPISRRYMLIGLVGDTAEQREMRLNDLNKITL